MPSKKWLSQKVKDMAKEEGFHLIAITSAEPSSHVSYYEEWIKKGFLGDMDYLKRHEPLKRDPKNIFPEVKSIVSCALSYKTAHTNPLKAPPGRGLISNYAWGEDYHDIIFQKLNTIVEKLNLLGIHGKAFCDTGPILERSFAERAGIGWIGKNTCVINSTYGSYIFLGEILINQELDYDTSETDHCGSCTRCLEVCPTHAFLGPYELDATQCIAYLTVEKRGEFLPEEKKKVEGHVFGCDLCQEVCPWNQKSLTPNLECFKPREGNFLPELKKLQTMTEADFKIQFKKSPIKRSKYSGFMRNIQAVIEGG